MHTINMHPKFCIRKCGTVYYLVQYYSAELSRKPLKKYLDRIDGFNNNTHWIYRSSLNNVVHSYPQPDALADESI